MFKCMKSMEMYLKDFISAKAAQRALTNYDGTVHLQNAIKYNQAYTDSRIAYENAFHIVQYHCSCGECSSYFKINFNTK